MEPTLLEKNGGGTAPTNAMLMPLRPTSIREDGRGRLVEIINRGKWAAVLHGTFSTGAVLGNHYHKRTEVFLFLLSGIAQVNVVCTKTLRRSHTELRSGEGLSLRPNEAHAIRFDEASEVIILKSQAYTEDDPDTFSFTVYESTEPSVLSRGDHGSVDSM